MASKILVLNGPNLNLLGERQPHIYGRETLDDIAAACKTRAATLDLEVDFRQSNSEGELVDMIQEAGKGFEGLIINAGAYTHTSIAILDALNTFSKPIIEVHLSNIYQRESFRHRSFVAEAAQGSICGFGGMGYELALEAIKHILSNNNK